MSAKFRECPSCAAKAGSPDLCPECLERRSLMAERDRSKMLLTVALLASDMSHLTEENDPMARLVEIAHKHGRAIARGEIVADIRDRAMKLSKGSCALLMELAAQIEAGT